MKNISKRLLSGMVAAIMTLGLLSGCGETNKPGTSVPSSTPAPDQSPGGNFKIAIMHTDASQGEEPTRAFEQLKAKYGDMVVGSAFPTGEQEVLVSTALGLVADPDVKALLIFQEPAGSAAAVNTISRMLSLRRKRVTISAASSLFRAS